VRARTVQDGYQVKLADHIGFPVQRIKEIGRGKRGITPETAWLFSQAFGTTPQLWINLQTNPRSRAEQA